MKKSLFFITAALFFLTIPVSAEVDDNGSACLMNAVTGEVVYEKNAYTERPMASTTKIMTAMVALENSDLTDIVTMSNEAVRAGGSSTYAKAGDQLYMEDALIGAISTRASSHRPASMKCCNNWAPPSTSKDWIPLVYKSSKICFKSPLL